MNVIKFNTKTELINNWKLIDEKFINEGQLGKLFNFNSIPTIYEELNNKLYLHIKGEVIGNFYSGIDRESIESFNDNEEKGVIVGKAKPLYRIVKNTNGEIEKLRGSTNISIRDLLSVPYNDEGNTLSFNSQTGGLNCLNKNKVIAKWQYWNTAWDNLYPKNSSPSVGMSLIGEPKKLLKKSNENDDELVYIWRFKNYSREQTYNEYDISQEIGYLQYRQ